jgi:hypothetical protein
MAYTYLSLVNDVNNKMNEVPLSEGNFADAAGFYSDAKNAVNYAVDKINRVNWEWPWNHITKELTLVVDQARYEFEVDCKTINWNSFRIKGSVSGNVQTSALWPKDYEDYVVENSDMEYRPTLHHAVPEVIVRTPELKFVVVPPPDRVYTLVYEYSALPVPLELWDDAPSVPQFFRNVINDGSFAQAFKFRGDGEMAADYDQKFQEGIENMRTIYTNRTEYVTATTRRK